MKDNATEQYSQPLSEPAHALEREAVVTQLKADPRQGLSSAEAKSRLEQYGKNELDDGPGVQPFKILLRQVANAMMLVSCNHRRSHQTAICDASPACHQMLILEV